MRFIFEGLVCTTCKTAVKKEGVKKKPGSQKTDGAPCTAQSDSILRRARSSVMYELRGLRLGKDTASHEEGTLPFRSAICTASRSLLIT